MSVMIFLPTLIPRRWQQKKTETDAAKIVADDIALRLGAYFHTKFSNKGNLDDFQTSTDR